MEIQELLQPLALSLDAVYPEENNQIPAKAKTTPFCIYYDFLKPQTTQNSIALL